MSLERSVLEEFECPVCTEYLFPPIRQCVQGHSVCYNCFIKVSNCPVCRKPKGVSRSYALENLFSKLSFPCKWRKHGCTEIIVGSNLKDHENDCKFLEKACPLLKTDNCRWVGPIKDLIDHCDQKHPNNVFLRIMVKYPNYKEF